MGFTSGFETVVISQSLSKKAESPGAGRGRKGREFMGKIGELSAVAPLNDLSALQSQIPPGCLLKHDIVGGSDSCKLEMSAIA
jgi:hypothetical protein